MKILMILILMMRQFSRYSELEGMFDGRAVITQESDSISDDETGMLMQSDEQFDQFSDDEMANMEKKSIELSASDVILASCALPPENAASKVMRQRHHSLQQDFSSGRRVVDSMYMRGGVKMELIDSPSNQVERPSYTDLSTEKIAFQHPEVNAASSSNNIGFLSPEANYCSTRTLYDYSDPFNSNITSV